MNLAFTLGRLLMHVRPAPLAVLLKHALFIRRQIVTTRDGTFWVDPASDAGQRVFATGRYDAVTDEILQHVLRPGDTFVDLGANEGYVSIAAARLVGETGRVIAIEPQARLQEVLRRNFALNHRRVELLAVAVSDRPGTATLQLAPDMNNSATGLASRTRYRLATQEVPQLTLAQVFEQRQVVAPIVLKIDIESWEHEAILGSPEIFRAGLVRVLVLELHPTDLVARGLDPKAVPDFLHSCGYLQIAGGHGIAWARPNSMA